MPFKNPHPLYHAWMSMKDRCRNPNNRQYKDYGGRGITVCDRWKSSFQNFVDDMGPRPDGYSLDRIDNDGNYTPKNCRWSSRKEQQMNRRYTRTIWIDGAEYVLQELSDRYGVPRNTIEKRVGLGLPFDAVTTKGNLRSLGIVKHHQSMKTHCPKGHPYDEENTYIRPSDGARSCRTCHRAKTLRQRRAKRAALRTTTSA